MARFIKSFQNDAAIQAAVDDKSLGHPYVALNDATGKIDWNTKEEKPNYRAIPMTFEVTSPGTINFYGLGIDTPKSIMYSIDNGLTWGTLNASKNSGSSITVSVGDKVIIVGNEKSYSDGIDKFCTFMNSTAKFKIYGNVMSMFSANSFQELDAFQEDNALMGLFYSCTGLTDISNLVLPATVLTERCYYYMFAYCNILETAPELPATELADRCYEGMFYSSQNINYIKCLATNISTSNSTDGWLDGVSPTGTFVKKAGVTWPTGNSGIPSGWTVIEE